MLSLRPRRHAAGWLIAAVAALAIARAPARADLPPNAYLLYEATTKGDTATVEHMLVDQPTLAVLKMDNGITMLHGAALADEPLTVRLLIKAGVFVDVRGGAQPMTPLFLAALKDHARTAAALLDAHADPNTKGDVPGDDGAAEMRPLHLAAINGDCGLASLLIQKGAILDPVTADGATPAEYARRAGHETLRNLIAAYRMFGRVRGRPIADLITAISVQDSAAVERAIARAPRVVNVKLLDDWTPLHIAANDGARAACQVLLEHHANPLAHEKTTQWTAAYRAYTSGHPAVCEFLRTYEKAAVPAAPHRR